MGYGNRVLEPELVGISGAMLGGLVGSWPVAVGYECVGEVVIERSATSEDEDGAL